MVGERFLSRRAVYHDLSGVITAFVGGYPAGLLSAVLAGLSQWYFFIPQFHWLAVLTYVIDAVVCVLLIEFVNRGLEKETEAARHETLLREELQHRIQNLFAVIQAVIRFSLPSNEARVSAAAIKDGLLDRLQALVDANRHVSDSTGEIALIDLIHGQMRVFAERYTVHGRPQVTLNPQLTQNFSLILHELVTNSLKYGALSAADGSVQIKLQEVPTGVLFDWRESGGPSVIAPPADGADGGFGSRISWPVCAELLRRRRHRLRANGLALQFATAPPAKHVAVKPPKRTGMCGRSDRRPI